jgi:hypothetical protein
LRNDVADDPALRTPQLEAALRDAANDWLAVHDRDEHEWRAYRERWQVAIRRLVGR